MRENALDRDHVKIVELDRAILGATSWLWNDVQTNTQHCLIADDILDRAFVRKRLKQKRGTTESLAATLAISVGDYVVHTDHGVARYAGIVRKTAGGVERDYMQLDYAEGDRIFVPVSEAYRVGRYVGNAAVKLTRLSSGEWQKAVAATTADAEADARELLETYAARELAEGIPMRAFETKETEFSAAFPYVYTADQLSAIEDIGHDMERDRPMDRLLCGDVGFGKTEVAMHAAYRAYLNGYQTVCVTPLVVLAHEHADTFERRLGTFGVKVAVLSRLSSGSEVKRVLAGLKDGSIHVVIGTHRLLSGDVIFKRLGLLILDEEHRFGVMDKERIRAIRSSVDTLALSATPIPRTLNLALSGVRKMSLLTTPPQRKKAVETIVVPFDENTFASALRHELERGGQVLVINNRIATLSSVADMVRALAGKKVRVATTHGRMDGDALEDTVLAFKRREYDVLVTTTVIENGVNFLGANTVCIFDSGDFGL